MTSFIISFNNYVTEGSRFEVLSFRTMLSNLSALGMNAMIIFKGTEIFKMGGDVCIYPSIMLSRRCNNCGKEMNNF